MSYVSMNDLRLPSMTEPFKKKQIPLLFSCHEIPVRTCLFVKEMRGEDSRSKHSTGQSNNPPDQKGGCSQESQEIPGGEKATSKSCMRQKFHGTILEECCYSNAGCQDGDCVGEIQSDQVATREWVELIFLGSPNTDDTPSRGEDDCWQVEDLWDIHVRGK